MKTSISRFLHVLFLVASACAPAISTSAQSNIVINGSFEDGTNGWQFTNSFIFVPPDGSVDGTNFTAQKAGSVIWQDLQTVPGRDYYIEFANPPSVGSTVRWGTNTPVLTDGRRVGFMWRYHYGYAHADDSVTRLSIEGGGTNHGSGFVGLDDVRVGWLQEPISILAQPVSATGFEGGVASFAANAQGGPPLSYQWAFDGVAIFGETNRVLTLTNLRTNHAGGYSVLVSNVAGAAWSDSAVLNVEVPSTSPTIIVQPESQTLPAGYAYTLTSAAVGKRPILYQWFQHGQAIANATNSSLLYASMTTNQNGTYFVMASNAIGTASSLPCTIVVTNASGGGRLYVSNNVAIRDIDGTTSLSGSNFFAQIYAGPTPDLLRPLGSSVAFRTGSFAGSIVAPRFVMPDVQVGAAVYGQMRAWETARGRTYEEARATGGRFGFSEIRQYTAASSPAVVHLMSGFALRPGLPFFYAGRLSASVPLPDGTPQFILTGAPGFRYLIERQFMPNNWLPLTVVTNRNGMVLFSDSSAEPISLYRSRILD